MTSANQELLRREARLLWEQALQYQYAGDLDQAIEHYRLSIELVPTAEAHTYLGWALSLTGDFNAACDECKSAIDLDPDFGNPYNDIGVYLIHEFRFDEALPWLEKALKAPRYDWPHFPTYNLGTIWEFKGLWKRAARYYSESLTMEERYQHASKAQKRVLGLMRGKQGLRSFTLEEANKTLPFVSQVVGDIHLVWSELVPNHVRYFEALKRKQEREGTGEALSPAANPKDEGLNHHVEVLENLNAKLRVYLKELHHIGIQVASPATGTIHYLTYLDGKQAYYSWRLGDGPIKYWQPLEDDSNDRLPLA
jgi:Tfp pilus assembly protein PilF